MKWSILVLTQEGRVPLLDRLLTVLGWQVAKHHEEVELVIRQCDPRQTLGENRNQLVRDAVGEYVSFVDDDDLVSLNYVATLLPKLDGVDMVGFKSISWENGKRVMPSSYSLKYKDWGNDGVIYFRDISHLCPIRREIVVQVPFEGNRGEDHRWVLAVRKLGLIKKEHFVDDYMYLYEYWETKPKDEIAVK